MAINRITVKNAKGDIITTINKNIKIAGLNDTIIINSLSGAATVITIKSGGRIDASDQYIGIYASAVNTLLQQRFILKINNVSGSETGDFYIEAGDSCMSWDALPNSEFNVHYHPTSGTGRYLHRVTGNGYDGTSMTFTRLSNAGGLKLYDMCPTCVSCDNALAIRKRTEWISAMLNEFKDVNLYAQDIRALRRQHLAEARLSPSAGCATPPGGDYSVLYSLPLDWQLLGNYLTTIHMWNYVVNTNNSAIEIEDAPEDPAGIVIQSAQAFPTCDGAQSQARGRLKFEAWVELVSGPDKDTASTFVSTTAYRKPFGTLINTPIVEAITADRKYIHAEFRADSTADTYFVQLKILPFINIKSINTDGSDASVEDYQAYPPRGDDINAEDEYGDYAMHDYQTGIDMTYGGKVLNPTLEMWEASRLYPSTTVTDVNTWSIRVKWTISGIFNPPHEIVTTYYYQAKALRMPVNELYTDLDITDTE